MRNVTKRLIKLTLGLCAFVVLAIALALTSSADGQAPDGYLTLDLNTEYSLTVTPEGYEIDRDSELTSHTGGYILTGVSRGNIYFKNNDGEGVTYDVILHNLDGTAKAWYGCVVIDANVTLNLVVYGDSKLIGYNHPGILAEGDGVVINITVVDGSRLEVGYDFDTELGCIGGDPTINILSGESSLDITDDGWEHLLDRVEFTNGTLKSHTIKGEKIDDESCLVGCEDCELLTATKEHSYSYVATGNDTNHSRVCTYCSDTIAEQHVIVYGLVDNDYHESYCSLCNEILMYGEHTLVDGKCTVCEQELILIHKDESGNERGFFVFTDAINYAKSWGGTLVLQRDINAYDESIHADYVDYTFDFNGYTIEDTYICIGGRTDTATLTVTDTSDAKTGGIGFSSISTGVYGGTLNISYISGIRAVFVDSGTVILNSTEHGLLSLSVYNGGTAKLNDITARDLSLSLYSYDPLIDSIELMGGTFEIVKLENTGALDIGIIDLLKDGYALYDAYGNVVNGGVKKIVGKTSISQHTHDTVNTINASATYYHYEACGCGVQVGGTENHDMGDDGRCTVCSAEIAAVISYDDTTLYFAGVEEAFGEIPAGKSTKITLYKDTTVNNEIYLSDANLELDLQGKNMKMYNWIYVDANATLTVTDSSENQDGLIEDYYGGEDDVISVIGKLIWNAGSLLGGIKIEGSYDSMARVDLNGGVIDGALSLHDNAALYISGARFNDFTAINLLSGSFNAVTVKINAGIFEEGVDLYDYGEILTINDLLATDVTCGLTIIDEYGNVLDLTNEVVYKGYFTIAHGGATLYKDENGHGYTCSSCEITYNREEHRSYEFTKIDDSTHSYACGICEYLIGTGAHTGTEANCTDKAFCAFCAVEYGDIAPDNHSGGRATCVSLAVCDRCESEYGVPDLNNHESKETKYVSKNDKHEHQRVCCSTVLGSYDHSYDDACDAECNVCKATRTVAHIYATDGRCIICGTEGGEVQIPKTYVSTGAIVGTSIGSVVLFGTGSFALIWFVLKKKSWNDLIKIFAKFTSNK